MSRIGKQPVAIPAGVKVRVADGKVFVEGPKGKLELAPHRNVTVQLDEQGHKAFQQEQDLSKPHMLLRVFMNYGPEGERVIRHIERASRPGRRLYRRSQQLRPVLDGLGISVISTSKGVMSDRKARAQKLGGELLCTVW